MRSLLHSRQYPKDAHSGINIGTVTPETLDTP